MTPVFCYRGTKQTKHLFVFSLLSLFTVEKLFWGVGQIVTSLFTFPSIYLCLPPGTSLEYSKTKICLEMFPCDLESNVLCLATVNGRWVNWLSVCCWLHQDNRDCRLRQRAVSWEKDVIDKLRQRVTFKRSWRFSGTMCRGEHSCLSKSRGFCKPVTTEIITPLVQRILKPGFRDLVSNGEWTDKDRLFAFWKNRYSDGLH